MARIRTGSIVFPIPELTIEALAVGPLISFAKRTLEENSQLPIS